MPRYFFEVEEEIIRNDAIELASSAISQAEIMHSDDKLDSPRGGSNSYIRELEAMFGVLPYSMRVVRASHTSKGEKKMDDAGTFIMLSELGKKIPPLTKEMRQRRNRLTLRSEYELFPEEIINPSHIEQLVESKLYTREAIWRNRERKYERRVS